MRSYAELLHRDRPTQCQPALGKVPYRLGLEGRRRGTSGVQMLSIDGGCGVAGLYPVGDVDARDHIVDAPTGADGPDLSWTVAIGTWSIPRRELPPNETAVSTPKE